MMGKASMVEVTSLASSQNARRQRNDRLVRRWTATAATFAFGLTAVLAGLSASAVTPHQPATPPEQLGPAANLGPAADAALAKAIADYAAASAPRHVAAANRPVAVSAPGPVAARHQAVAVSGGS
jgi:hypothetical protein